MKLLSSQQVQRIYEVTDGLGVHRNWVVVPLATGAGGAQRVLPDGKVLVVAPTEHAFEAWLPELRRKLCDLNLSRTPRQDDHQPPLKRRAPEAPPGSSSSRYLPWRGRRSRPSDTP
ncbi:MAG: hypothetical protein HYY16_11605 [Planctomycetes bacterium]|nr:hypothetical protein [Planctomycetota bacterium]